ncbi:MAG: GNAT family N-acetyltransferase [Armatimonadota bacterium]
MSETEELPLQVQMRGGGGAVLRHITADDYEQVLQYFDGLSDLSRKYFCPHPFDEKHARMIVQTSDRTDNVRIGAFAESADGPLVGYFYYQHGEGYKYPSVGCGIIDEYHDRGLGTPLMEALIAEARRNNKPGLRLTVDKPNHRALRLYSKSGYRIIGEAQGGSHHEMVLDFEAEKTPFRHRCMYAHPIDWKLTHLTADTFTGEEWRRYLDLVQAAGANMLKIFIWPTQYFHPDHPETAPQQWYWETLREALAYAHVLDLETHVGFAGNAVPPSVWLDHPDERATEVNYNGIELCWQRGKETVLEFSGHLIDYFADTADGFIVWYADPGLCACEQCVPYTPVMLDIRATYETLVDDRAQVHHCPWWIWHMEQGKGDIPASPGIQHEFFNALPEGDWTLVYSEASRAMQEAQDAGLDVLNFAFFMDPEGGDERHNILPMTKFDRIEAEVAAAGESSNGVLAYRLTPYTQFHQDWLFFYKQLYPNINRSDALQRLAHFVGTGDDYIRALTLLDDFWMETRQGNYDVEAVTEAAEILDSIVPERPEYLTHVAAAARVLQMLVEHGLAHDWSVNDELVAALHEHMSRTSTFTSLTHEKLWVTTRSHPVIRRRAENWMRFLQPEEN